MQKNGTGRTPLLSCHITCGVTPTPFNRQPEKPSSGRGRHDDGLRLHVALVTERKPLGEKIFPSVVDFGAGTEHGGVRGRVMGHPALQPGQW